MHLTSNALAITITNSASNPGTYSPHEASHHHKWPHPMPHHGWKTWQYQWTCPTKHMPPGNRETKVEEPTEMPCKWIKGYQSDGCHASALRAIVKDTWHVTAALGMPKSTQSSMNQKIWAMYKLRLPLKAYSTMPCLCLTVFQKIWKTSSSSDTKGSHRIFKVSN